MNCYREDPMKKPNRKANQTKKKRSITLIEMIVVMLLIATITGAIAYNYNESLNEGKAFKTREGIQRIKTILALEIAENPDAVQEIDTGWQSIVKRSPLVQNPEKFILDGWGKPYSVTLAQSGDDGKFEIQVESEGYNAYKAKKNRR